MRRSTLLILAGVLTMVAEACTPFFPVPPPPPPAPPAPIAADQRCSDGTSISSKVVALDVKYNPEVDGTSPPQSIGLSSYGSWIQKAFNLATQDLRDRLCALDKIYIAEANTDHAVWGIREKRNRTRHIGISKELLDKIIGTWTSPYAQYEMEIVDNLLWRSENPEPDWLRHLTYKVVGDSPSIAVLAILAHEIGHTMWWHRGVMNLKCDGVFFANLTWDRINIPPGFHHFGDKQRNKSIEDFDIDDMANLLSAGSLNALISNMHQVYEDGNWANLFSFVAPDEDFIETYKFQVLQDAGVSKIDLEFPGTSGAPDTINVLTNFASASSGSPLGKKKAWIASWLQGACKDPNGNPAHP